MQWNPITHNPAWMQGECADVAGWGRYYVRKRNKGQRYYELRINGVIHSNGWESIGEAKLAAESFERVREAGRLSEGEFERFRVKGTM
jgi:hypothetical protein